MILKNIETGREIDVDFNFFREEYADAIKKAFDKYREEKLTLYPENFKDDYSMEFNFYIGFEYLFNQYSSDYEVIF